MTTICVATRGANKTTTGVERGLDVAVTVTLPGGAEVKGEVTLLPHADGRPGYGSWGDPDNWVSAPLLRAMTAAYGDDLRDALGELAAAAAAECPS